MNIKRTSIVLVVIVATGGALLAWGQPEGTPDHELSLSRSSVLDVPQPPEEMANVSDPGDRPVQPTDFPEQPPIVPHGLTEHLPITLEENTCMECHLVEEKVEGEPTPIPPSHFVDLRNAPSETQSEVVGARYNCVACHVVPGDSALLVENEYEPGR